MFSLSITHELRQAKAESLPDIVLDNIPHYAWALGMSKLVSNLHFSDFSSVADLYMSPGFLLNPDTDPDPMIQKSLRAVPGLG